MAGGGKYPGGHKGGSDDAVTADELIATLVAKAGTSCDGNPLTEHNAFLRESTIGSNQVITNLQATDSAIIALIAVRSIDTQILSADATTVTFSGLANADGVAYLIVGQCVGGTGVAASDLTMRPNGATANQQTQLMANATNAQTTTMRIGGSSPVGIPYGFRIYVYPRQGTGGRMALSECFYDQGGGGGNNVYFRSGSRWLDNAEITSIDLVASVASAFGAGSILTIYSLEVGP